MVQPAKKGRESSSELESKGSNKRQKSSDQAGQETPNVTPTTKRQARNSGDQSASTRKRSKSQVIDSDSTPDNSNLLAENTTTISEVDTNNVPAIRENAIEKRMELIKQLLDQKENELKEIAFLESGHNLLDFDPSGKGKLVTKEEPTDSVDGKKAQRSRENTPARTKRQSSSDSLISSAPQTPIQTTPPPTTPQQLQDAAPAAQAPVLPLPTFPSIFATPPAVSDKVRAAATHDAGIIRRVGDLQRSGLWSLKRMPKAPEPPRVKVHWDHVLAEMAWLANDFKQERKWKMALAKKVSKQVLRYHQMQETREQRRLKEEEQQIRKVASGIAREVKKFWQKIEKVVQFKQQAVLDEKKKEVMDKHLDFLVGQTEKYFEMIASDLKQDGSQPQENITQEAKPVEDPKMVRSHTQDLLMESEEASEGEAAEEDAEFELPDGAADEVDDEETLEEEETKDLDDLPKGEEELSQLQRESEMPLEDIIKQIKEHAGEEGDEEEANDEEEEDMDDNDGKTGQERISEAAAAANAAQPTGFTLSTTKVKTKVPFLLHGTLREYQHIGLDWIVTMYEKRLNGILADEMGLGKTIMTISMLAHLACEKGIWGPHLIVVPTSVMLNWELEFKKWCPAFKILTYFGSQKERKLKRQGWSKTNSFHVCITSYKVVVQDQQAFRRKKWKYFILDEAHNIKNFRSQRWQVLLNFNSKRRLLLTGTPLQNSLMELWSLMHFLMPHMFQSHKEFKDWFSNPVTGMIEGSETLNEDLITRLHAILRPFLLRRLKKDVEKQLPNKYHHLVSCQLSKRQRFLYEEFISSAATQDTLKSGNFLGIINVLMQLRKVCNHPDLFEGRPIISPFDMESLEFYTSSAVCRALEQDPFESVNLPFLNLSLASAELEVGHLEALSTSQLRTPPKIIEISASPPSTIPTPTPSFPPSISGPSILDEMWAAREERLYQTRLNNLKQMAYINELRCSRKPLYGCELIRSVQIHKPVQDVHLYAQNPSHYLDYPDSLADLVRLPESRAAELNPSTITQFICIIPKARAPPPIIACPHPHPSTLLAQKRAAVEVPHILSPMVDIFRPAFVRAQVYFPDKRLVQYDCGKLQQLDILLRTLKSGAHRALIFTQMTRMLDVLEAFLNVHGYTYLRLDGATKVEKRQQLTERFNADPKIFVFILSTRSGGVGINLTGADSVIFYDSDWNPAMDAQAQDRCHRIGQTRDVHIYRLITEYTIEENILKKANQKRHLDDMVIQGGGFTTDFFKNVDIRDLFETSKGQIESDSAPVQLTKERGSISQRDWESAVANAEDETDATALRQAQAEQEYDVEEFNEETTPHDVTTPGGTQSTTGEDMSFLQDDFEEQGNKLANSSSGFSFEDSLLPIQRYAMHFFESENALSQESIDAMDEEVDARQQEWQLENAKRMKEEEEERMSEDDDLLFYEVSGNAAEFKAKLLAEMDVYCPPNPDHELLYIPPFDGDDYLSILPPIPPSFFDDEDEIHPQNEQPEKKTLIPLTPPGEVGDGEIDTEHEGIVKKKRIRHKKDHASSVDATPHSPPSPTPQPKQARRGRPKDPPGGLFTQRRRKQKGEPTTTTQKVKEGQKDKDPWSAEEDTALAEAVRTYGLNWDLACDVLLSNPSLPSRRLLRTPSACAERYRSVILPKTSGEAGSTSPPPSPVPLSQSQGLQQPHFGIMDIIRNMVTQKKDIPGMIGSVAQTDQSVPPHASHFQAAMQAGVAKALTPREVVAMLAHKIHVVVPPKEVPPLSKIGQKSDPKVSGFGQGYTLGLINLGISNAAHGVLGGTGVPNQAMIPGQGLPPGSVPVANPAGYSIPIGGTNIGVPASNSIIINPNGGNAQTSRKLAQINQSMHPSVVQAGLPRTGAGGTAGVGAAGAPGVVVAIPNATTSVTVMPRGNGNNATNVNTPVAPTVNVNAATPVVPSAPVSQPAPVPAPTPAVAKPSSKRSKKNADGTAASTKRQRTKNPPVAATAAATAATAATTATTATPAVTEQPQPTPSQPVQATPPTVQSQPTMQPHVAQQQHPHMQPQQLQHSQIHQLQQIQQQLLQHQQPHLAQSQATNTGQMQPNQLTHQPQQHMQPGMMYQQGTQPQGTQQPQQAQPIQATQPYTAAQYATQPTYATAGTYATPAAYSTPATGITYTTTYANPGYPAAPGSAPSTFTTPSPATNYATPANFTNPTTYPATYSTGVAPTFTATPSTTPNTYTTSTAPTTASNNLMGSGYTVAPSTYIPNNVSAGAFTAPSTTSYSAPGYAPQGMVIGVPQQQGAMMGGMTHNVIKGRAQQQGVPPGTLRPAAMHTTTSPGQTAPSVSSPSPAPQ